MRPVEIADLTAGASARRQRHRQGLIHLSGSVRDDDHSGSVIVSFASSTWSADVG